MPGINSKEKFPESYVGVLLQGFFFGPGRVVGVPSPADGDPSISWWWDHLASQANDLARAGFSAIWLPPAHKGASGTFSSGYDLFDDYDLGSKNQKGTTPTRYGTKEQLQRCAAMLRANGIDIYVDLVQNQRDGDDGHFHFNYLDAFGFDGKGRFTKGPEDFHPHVPEDPGVFSDAFQFGRDLAPINGGNPKGQCGEQLLQAAEWLTQAIDAQGFRLDNAKGVSTDFVVRLLGHGALRQKFAVAEFADGNIGLIQAWADAVQHVSSAFDFPLHFALKQMCNSPETFSMASLDHAGLAGVDPQGAVTFVENHDTDRGGVGGPIIRNKMLAYAYMLTSEGYPCVFYRDYSHDKNCFGLKDGIDRLIWIHERLAAGATEQCWKDDGVFAFERLGGEHLLVGLNKDRGAGRTIRVQTGFPANTELQNFTDDHAPRIRTDAQAAVTMTIPRNQDGKGYVCYARPTSITPFAVVSKATTQVFVGAKDLDLKPALEGVQNLLCRLFVASNTNMELLFSADEVGWAANTGVEVGVKDQDNSTIGQQTLRGSGNTGLTFHTAVKKAGFHSIFVRAENTPPHNKQPAFSLRVRYTAPQKV
jgi:alpha-amylase